MLQIPLRESGLDSMRMGDEQSIGLDRHFQGLAYGRDLLVDSRMHLPGAAQAVDIAVVMPDGGELETVAKRPARYTIHGREAWHLTGYDSSDP